MIKVGQFLSARLDVLPLEITEELAGLQDEVRPEKFEDIRVVIEKEFGCTLEEKFTKVDSNPIASASIGQVHSGYLRINIENGNNNPSPLIVIKVQRPNIQMLVATDLAAIRVVGKWIQNYPLIRKRISVEALIDEFSRSLYEEMDYIHEGKNAERFAENFKQRPDIRVPKVYWEYTTTKVLTLEDVRGIKITDYAKIEQAGISRAEVADRLFNTYLQQIFEDGFFHADPHPGNLFVLPVSENPVVWQLVFVDFGMAGVISTQNLTGLKELLIAIGTQDSKRIIQAYQTLGILLPDANLDLLEKASSRVFERFWGKTAPEMMKMHQEEAVKFVQEFSELIYDLPFQVPENLILFARCLGILSGICTGLSVDFNVWTKIGPFARKLVESESGSGWQFWLNEIGSYLQLIISLPRKTETLLNKLEQGRLEVQNPELSARIALLNVIMKKLVGAVLFLAFSLVGVLLYISGYVIISEAIAICGLITLGWIILSR